MLDWMKYRLVYLILSLSLILIGVFSLLKWGLNLGVDFTGGAMVEYGFGREVSSEEVTNNLQKMGYDPYSIQKAGENTYLFKFPPLEREVKDEITRGLKDFYGEDVEELRFENVGPSIGPDLVKKTIVALIVSASAILLWVAFQFKSIKFGGSAVLAMFHDSFILIGSFALLGHFFSAEVDFLFVTALLTTLSFSVHDTIVVYDRIRESQKKEAGEIYDLANKAISETMVRSLNNSFTIIFMLVALILMGGATVKWFSIALLIGTILGTYSSPFVAVSLLVSIDDLAKRIKIRKNK